jgi:Lon protease-like protein
MSQEPLSPDEFGGVVRLFPLPNLVLFPHVGQPLHVFEPRYRQLMADALDDDRLIAMALLRPGWEQEYHNRPPIHDTVCVGKIRQEESLPDGRYNLLLQGVCRARVVEEIDSDKMYRLARVELCPDEPVASPTEEETLRDRLGRGVLPFFSAHPPAMEQLRGLIASPIALGSLCDIFCFALALETEDKQRLLAECDTGRRVRLLLDLLDGKTPPSTQEPPRRRYPPEFSPN